MLRRLPLLLALFGAAAAAQAPAPPSDAAPQTPAEEAVRATIAQPGVHVVHFWAPWCGNSTNELATGWYETIEAHPDVSFTFVAIWNDGEDGASMLQRYAIPESVTVLAQPDLGPSADRANRRTLFLGLPLSWTPSTWIFNRNGRLATAFNYGEVSAEMLEAAITHASHDWTHD